MCAMALFVHAGAFFSPFAIFKITHMGTEGIQFGRGRVHTELIVSVHHVVLSIIILSADLCHQLAGDRDVRVNLREASIENRDVFSNTKTTRGFWYQEQRASVSGIGSSD